VWIAHNGQPAKLSTTQEARISVHCGGCLCAQAIAAHGARAQGAVLRSQIFTPTLSQTHAPAAGHHTHQTPLRLKRSSHGTGGRRLKLKPPAGRSAKRAFGLVSSSPFQMRDDLVRAVAETSPLARGFLIVELSGHCSLRWSWRRTANKDQAPDKMTTFALRALTLVAAAR